MSYGYAGGASLSEPAGPSSIVGAARWIEGLLTGSVATAIAVIAVASIGLMMLGGRVDVRRGLAVVLGCFLVFGAASIAAGLRGLADGIGLSSSTPVEPAIAPPPPPQAQTPPSGYDPYAGAAVMRN